MLSTTTSLRKRHKLGSKKDDEDFKAILLKRLQSHGEKFMASFEENEGEGGQVKKKQKRENFLKKEAKFDNKEVLIIEEDHTTEDEDIKPLPLPEARKHEVVIFDGSFLTNPINRGNKTDYKAFMASKVAKMRVKVPSVPANKLEQEEEQQNLQNDQELQDLLRTSNLIETLTVENMEAKEKRRFMNKKLVELGARPLSRPKMPYKMALRVKVNRPKRAEKKLQEAKNLGLYHRTTKHLYTTSTINNKKKSPGFRRERGLRPGIGKFKNGELRLSRREIQAVERGDSVNIHKTSRGDKSGKKNKKSDR